MNNIKYIHFSEIVRPLRTIFSTSLGKKDLIKSVIVTVSLKEGSYGVGECPTSFTLKDETIPIIKNVLAEISQKFIGKPIDEYAEDMERLRRKYPANPMTVSGLEVALFRAHLKSRHISEHAYWGGRLTSLETDITVPYLTDSAILTKWLEYTIRKGFNIFKLKVSGHIQEDMQFISLVYGILKERREHFVLRLDGNQGFTEKTFFRMLDYVEGNGYPVQVFEQPLPKADYRGLKEIKKRSSIPIILDETIFTAQDLSMAVSEDLCHGINIKIAKSGISESGRMFKIAKKHGLKMMIGCMTETMTGLSAGLFFAAGIGSFDYIDLDSVYFLYHKNLYDNIIIKGPVFIIS